MKAQEENEKAIESGPLERLFNGTAPAKILDFLTVFREWDYSKMDIAKNSGVSFRHALREIPKLESLNLIRQTRRVGRATMYQYNTESATAKALREFSFQIATLEAEKIA